MPLSPRPLRPEGCVVIASGGKRGSKKPNSQAKAYGYTATNFYFFWNSAFRNPQSELILNLDGEFDEEGGAFGFVVPYPNISVVIGDDGVDNSQP